LTLVKYLSNEPKAMITNRGYLQKKVLPSSRNHVKQMVDSLNDCYRYVTQSIDSKKTAAIIEAD